MGPLLYIGFVLSLCLLTLLLLLRRRRLEHMDRQARYWREAGERITREISEGRRK